VCRPDYFLLSPFNVKLCVYYTTAFPLQSTVACVYTVTVLPLAHAAFPIVIFRSSSSPIQSFSRTNHLCHPVSVQSTVAYVYTVTIPPFSSSLLPRPLPLVVVTYPSSLTQSPCNLLSVNPLQLLCCLCVHSNVTVLRPVLDTSQISNPTSSPKIPSVTSSTAN